MAGRTLRLRFMTICDTLSEMKIDISKFEDSDSNWVRDSEKKNGDRSRVSFYSPAEIRERSQETEDTEYDRFSDDDDAGLLIRRDDVMESSLDQLSTEHLSSIGAVTHDSQSDDDDDEMSGLLIRREEADDYDHIDRHDILIDDGYENIGKFISIKDTEEKEATRITDDVASPTEHSGKEISNMKHTKDGINCVNEVVSSKMGTEADEDIDDDFQLFKSPLPSVSKRSQRNKNSKRKSKERKVDIGSESLHTPATWSVSSKHSCQQVTPILTCNQEDPDSYTTPLMDESLQQLTFDEASKAPQKRRQSSDNHTSNVEKLKALHSGRRVTRSLLVTGENQNKNTPDMIKSDKQLDPEPKSKTKRDLMVGSHQMDPRGDAGPITPPYDLAKMETSEPSASNCHSMPDQYQPKSQESGKSLKRNRHSTPGHHQSRPRESTIAFKRKIETHKQRNQSAFITNKARKEMSGLLVPHYNSPDVDESPDLLDICNSYGSPSSDSYRSPNQSQYTNPALEKALRNLRCTAMSSPSLSVEANSDVSSPGLLSPTLSGVSELSSTSSGPMDHDKITKSPPRAMDNAHCKMLTTEQMQPRTRSMDLCQLFNDVTPPDKKTKGPYRTQRIVSSGPCTDDKNFRQLFEDSDSLFC